MKVEPYLMFEGRCDEALDFYRRALGAEVTMLMRYKDNPEAAAAQGCGQGAGAGPTPEMVMHAAFKVGGAQLMASDGMGSGKPSFQGISLSLGAANAAEARRYFDALAEGGQVQMPFGPTFFSPAFGMVADRFGVSWMVVVEPQ
ncbi:VOC family protein [Acidovorax sp.]|uniref:VOC family protein n=1 Tax=Acidovorax sp. TaxID=1872122 RepID=UPI00263251F1|nr:VOC family protein [Acidovorax sp.]